MAGLCLFQQGEYFRPQDVGLLAAMGVDRPKVVRRPRAGILSTGDEVVPVDGSPGPGQVRDVNSHVLSAQVEAAGGVAFRLGLVSDDREQLRAAVNHSLAETDLTLLSGGSSVGTRDLTA